MKRYISYLIVFGFGLLCARTPDAFHYWQVNLQPQATLFGILIGLGHLIVYILVNLEKIYERLRHIL